ncbi:MAG: SDR family oxidoreductase [Actinomycetota bacterium]|nr:SDR family oxidoreductase [Actinomycetota bacterium]
MTSAVGRLAGKRVLVTSARTFMGPPVVDLFVKEGADVVADHGALLEPDEPAELIGRTDDLDILIANLDLPAYGASTVEITDDGWLAGFDAMVHPLMRLVRAAAPAMIARGSGSIVVLTSSSPLRRMSPQTISYVAARAAQIAFVRSSGHDLARYNVRLNGVAQNFVANDTYYPPEILANERFKERLASEVPSRRIGQPEESAELALYLAGDTSSFIFGQIISNDGGWS